MAMNTYRDFNLDKLRGLKPERIVICGMGGSGLPGEIIRTFAPEFGIKAEIIVWKDYGLPLEETRISKSKPQNTLYVFVSFSGETEETVSGFRAALKIKGAHIVVLTGGGELKAVALKNKLPFTVFERGTLQPREATALIFTGLVKTLKAAGVCSKEITLPRREKNNSVGKIVDFIDKSVPLIYSSHQLKSLSYIWKIWLNETAKTPAFMNELPELDHNEIVGFESHNHTFRAIFITDPTDSEKIIKRIAFTEKLIGKSGSKTLKVQLTGKTKFERFWKGVYLGEDVASVLAARKKIDPEETRSIGTLKSWLKK
jgi:glucose/mannose-6-phosphate isomerase